MRLIVSDKQNKAFCSYVDNLPYPNIINNELFFKNNVSNPLYKLNIGCYYARIDSINSRVFLQLFNGDSIHYQNIDSSFNYLREAYMMFPEEPIFAVNYSLAYFILGKNEPAIEVLESFSNIEDNSLELLCVLGVEYEMAGKDDMALYIYSKAISSFPEVLESEFYEDFKCRNAEMAVSALNNAVSNMQTEYDNSNDPVIASKVGLLYYEMGYIDKAEHYLFESVNKLPSLNRPWYYLGLIYETKGDYNQALSFFKRSYGFDRGDVLPLKKLITYNEEKQVILDYVNHNKRSKQAFRLEKVFGVATLRYPYIVSDLELYCRTCSN